ncbi:GNAT family N-acetyltransferase [Kitasatospora sp. NPDC051853]|uniref:GNAT family N-acetyltransferase n=1 Tax=Kitasatospora sp. NPDC051853 TaxID=3364058 RepID=UPI0037B8C01D
MTALAAPVRPAAPAALRPRPRRAVPADAGQLYALSRPFMRTGELRLRTPREYRLTAAQFLLLTGPDGSTVDGCAALRTLPPEPGRPATGVLHNLCVRPGRQGAGLGSALVAAVLAEARRIGLHTVCTATTGSGLLFERHGFTEVPPALAPSAWTGTLDPARGSRTYLHAPR